MHAPDRVQDMFLYQAGWQSACKDPIAGDASTRTYTRLTKEEGASAILMDDGLGRNTATFVRAADHFLNIGMSAPKTLHHDPETGFLLLEDFGENLFSKLIAHQPQLETSLYAAATDALTILHQHAPPDWAKTYDATMMADFIDITADAYANTAPEKPAWQQLKHALLDRLRAPLEAPNVLLHRDFHVENLVWLPDRQGVARVGLLDFQDALAGHIAYDLASLLQDARRDVPPALEAEMMDRFLRNSSCDEAAFRAAYAAISAQRHIRILGIFASLAQTPCKRGYLKLIPRVWGYLQRCLDHPDLTDLRDAVMQTLPAPSADHLGRLAPE